MIEINAKEQSKNNFQNKLEEILKDEELNKLLKEKLDSYDSLNLNLKLNKNNELVATVSSGLPSGNKEITKLLSNDNLDQNYKVEAPKKESTFQKFKKAFCNVCEDTFDEITKCFLKKKYKINNSVYNDSKSAIKSIISKDVKNFTKKITDVILRNSKN